MSSHTTYQCAACGTVGQRGDVVAAATPGGGAGWYCRDTAACRAAREAR